MSARFPGAEADLRAFSRRLTEAYVSIPAQACRQADPDVYKRQGLEAVPNQEERAAAFRYYVERVAAHPLGVGCHYFQCYDQFVLGRFDGENYNIGLFDICLLYTSHIGIFILGHHFLQAAEELLQDVRVPPEAPVHILGLPLGAGEENL